LIDVGSVCFLCVIDFEGSAASPKAYCKLH
jgi:hypothetical protein